MCLRLHNLPTLCDGIDGFFGFLGSAEYKGCVELFSDQKDGGIWKIYHG